MQPLKVTITEVDQEALKDFAPGFKEHYASKGARSAEILLYEEIGYWGIDAKMFADALKEIGDVDSIVLGINSPGGNAFDGIAMFNQLVAHPANVTARIDGVAASAASLVAMAGDKIIMAANSTIMIHPPMTVAIGDAKEFRSVAERLEGITDQYIDTYANRRNLDRSEVAEKIWAETWMRGQEAVDAGFADEVIETPAIAASIAQGRYRHTPAALLSTGKVYQPPPPKWRVAAAQRDRDLKLARETV